MPKQANIDSFLNRAGASALARTYGKMVAIELAVKDSLGLGATAHMQHDVATLLSTLATQRATIQPPVPAAALISQAQQLANQLSRLICCHSSGSRMRVPRYSYPYMRYVRHARDGWPTPHTDEQSILAVDSTANQILHTLRSSYGLPL
jgi:hypothetical protein